MAVGAGTTHAPLINGQVTGRRRPVLARPSLRMGVATFLLRPLGVRDTVQAIGQSGLRETARHERYQ